MRIVSGKVYGDDYQFHDQDLLIRGGIVADPEHCETRAPGGSTPEEEFLDASGCFVIPGLVDIHFHGAMGFDFCDGTPKALDEIAGYEASEGVTAVCPAALTLPVEELCAILDNAKKWAEGGRVPEKADLIGVNMEGPFISRAKKAAQNGQFIIPCDADVCRRFMEASGGLLKIIGLAPDENPGYEKYIREVKDFVKVSLAHTNADYDTAMRAIRAGASHAVHLFNGMPEMTHREPGVVGAVFESPSVFAELICDGNHLHPAIIRMAFGLAGEERIVLISDSIRAAGLGDGIFVLGGQDVIVKGPRAVLAQGGNLAGSVRSLTECMRMAVLEAGISLETAVRCASSNPAKAIGMDHLYGSLAPGCRGNAVLLDEEDLTVRAVVKDGVRIR